MKFRNSTLKHIKEDRQLIVMCVPAILKIFIFSYLPMFGIIVAFKNYYPSKGILGSPWNGLDNFKFFFRSGDLWRLIRNTIGMNFILIITGLIASVVFALLLYEITSRTMLKLYQSIMFFPYFFSWVVAGMLLGTLISPSGLLTTLATAVSGNDINFYQEPYYWIIILPLVNIWKGTGFGSLIYYAVLMSIDQELFDAAKIDGATKLQTVRYISLPFLMPMMVVMTILAIGGIVRSDFGLFYFIPKNMSLLYPVTDVIDTYVYRAVSNGNFTMSAAVGLLQSVVGFIMIMLTNRLAKSYDKDYGLF